MNRLIVRKAALALSAVVVAALIAVAFVVPDAAAAIAGAESVSFEIVLADAAALAALRTRLVDLETRAERQLDEIGDDTPPERVREIEAEHERLLGEIETVRGEIAQAETAGTRRAADPTPPLPDVAGAVHRAISDERARVAEIRSLCGRYGLVEMFVQRQIDEGHDVAAVRANVLEELARRDRDNPIQSNVETRGLQDERETMRRGMTAALEFRLGQAAGERGVEAPDFARQYIGLEVAEMAAECIDWRGHLRTGRQLTEMFQRAFHTTSDFPGIFTDALNNRLLARYQAATPSYRLISWRMTAADFREMNVIRAGDFPALQPINEAGEIRSGTFGESKEVFRVAPYGVSLRITRQMLVNDQLRAIDQVLASSGQRVADWENAEAYKVILAGSGAGPILKTDSKRVFHTDHGNLASQGTALTVASVGAGRAAMAKQKTLDGMAANIQPAVLLCGPDKITEAEQLLTSLTPAQQSEAVPQSIRSLTPVSDANIPGHAWYLFANPEAAPCFAYGYLEGFEGPRLTSEDVFDVQGLKVKLEHDFGFTGIDFRGGYRDPGAALNGG